MKIVPFEGKTLVCGYEQKDAEHFLPEVLISNLVSDLSKVEVMHQKIEFDEVFISTGLNRKQEDNFCPGMALTYNVKLCRGPYPTLLVNEWHQ